jgi:hypothetical protein
MSPSRAIAHVSIARAHSASGGRTSTSRAGRRAEACGAHADVSGHRAELHGPAADYLACACATHHASRDRAAYEKHRRTSLSFDVAGSIALRAHCGPMPFAENVLRLCALAENVLRLCALAVFSALRPPFISLHQKNNGSQSVQNNST